jgi:hypothetical protein
MESSLSTRAQIIEALRPDKHLSNQELEALLGISAKAISSQTSTYSRGENPIFGVEVIPGSLHRARRYFLLDPTTPATGKGRPKPKASLSSAVLAPPSSCEKATPQSEGDAPKLNADFRVVNEAVAELASLIGAQISQQLVTVLTRQVQDAVGILMKDLVAQYKEQGVPLQPQLADALATAVTKEVKKKLPSILVVGLLPAQAGVISAEFYNQFDLRFCDASNIQEVKRMAKNVDQVFLFTSKISHATDNAVRSVTHKITRVGGGVTNLKEALAHFELAPA